jgi:hypothetical protein
MKLLKKIWDELSDYIQTLPWGYIGAGLFLFLFLLFLYDTLASSQMSIKFILIVVVGMALCMYLGLMVTGGFSSGPRVNN